MIFSSNYNYKERENMFNKSLEWYLKSGNLGYVKAQLKLGYLYSHKLQDKESFEWYLTAAKQENAEAQYKVGDCYEYGEGVKKNKKEAIYWYKKAAAQGHEKAKFQLNLLTAPWF